MIVRPVRARSGITLTEILISILIMGIGMISLAVLFPLGLLKLRDAARNHRSSLLAQSATDDFDAKSLMVKESFIRTWYGNIDPFTSDSFNGAVGTSVQSLGPNSTGVPQPGLPVCYDPYWRAYTQVVPPNGNTNNAIFDTTIGYAPAGSVAAEARFGAAIIGGINAYGMQGGTQDSVAPGVGPSAYGLQRITNFIPALPGTSRYPFTYNPSSVGFPGTGVVADTFISADDIVFNSRDNSNGVVSVLVNGTSVQFGSPSPLLPDLSISNNGTNGTMISDFRYSWFFTGRQVDSTNGTMFQGDVVVCEGRQFAFNPLPAPNNTVSIPEGETVVEGIFGYSDNVSPKTFFAVGSDRTVLLRWPSSIPDPSVRIGGWIADVTYERVAATSLARSSATQTSFQRCNWYQVNKRTDAQTDPDTTNYPNFRRMVLTIASPVKTKTMLTTTGRPLYANAALVMPSVINVYPRAFSQ